MPGGALRAAEPDHLLFEGDGRSETGQVGAAVPLPGQQGVLALWDQVEDALLTWERHGSPDLTGFGATITLEEQVVWLGSPEGPSWHLPT